MTGTRSSRRQPSRKTEVKKSAKPRLPKPTTSKRVPAERKSKRILMKALKTGTLKTDLHIAVKVFGYLICQRDLIPGEELSASVICSRVTSYFEEIGGDVIIFVDESGKIHYSLRNMDFYDHEGRIPNEGLLNVQESIFRPQQKRPDCTITVYDKDHFPYF